MPLTPERRREINILVRWERWRRWLRRHGMPVPAFMLPTPPARDSHGEPMSTNTRKEDS